MQGNASCMIDEMKVMNLRTLNDSYLKIPYSRVIPLHGNMVNVQNSKYSFSAYEIRQRLQLMNPILQKLLAHFGLQRDRLFEQ